MTNTDYNKPSAPRCLAFQTGHTKRNGKGWDEWGVCYTLNLATDFAVLIVRS